LMVPMLKNNELIGAFSVYRQEVRPFTDKQIELVQNFAAQAVIAIENARLLNELRQSLEHQTATSDVLKVISRSTFDLQKVLDTPVTSAAKLCRAERASITLPKGDRYHRVASYGLSAEFRDFLNRHPLAIDRGSVVGRALLESRTVQIEDVQADPEFTFTEGARLSETRTALGVPLMREGSPIGVLALARSAVEPFTDRQIELVETFADQAVIAIENARLLNELRQRTTDLTLRTTDLTEALEQQTATSGVPQVISSSPGNLEPVFASMLENAVRICDASFGAMQLREDDGFRCVALYNAPPKFLEFHKKAPVINVAKASALSRILTEKRVVQQADLQAEEPDTPLAKYASARAVVVVPLLKQQDVIGAFGIYRQDLRPFTEKQIALVQNFADQAVIAIANARLLNELRQSLEQQTATADVLKVISRSTFDLQTVLDMLVVSAASLCVADRSAIWQRDGEFLRIWATNGVTAEGVQYAAEHPLKVGRNSGAGRAALEGQAVHILDVLAAPEYSATSLRDAAGYRTVLGVPLLRAGTVIGVFALTRHEVSPFSEKQIELVTTFADQAVIAIENTRLLDELRQRTTDLSEALEQQTATSEVLQVISSSPNDLEPVFASMLDNAVRICDAKFGSIYRSTSRALQLVATRNAPAGYTEARRHLATTPQQGDPMDRALTTKSIVHIADLTAEASYMRDVIRKWLCTSSRVEYAQFCSFLCCWRTNQSAYSLCSDRRSDPSLTKR
jgi:GAF domain-containing protein